MNSSVPSLLFITIPLLLTTLLFYFFNSLSTSRNKKSHKLPPEAGGARLFTGHLHLMGGGADLTKDRLPHYNLASLADQHGPIFTIRLGMRRALVVSSHEIVKELFTTHDTAVSTRPKLRAFKHLSYDFAMFAFAPYGDYWREARKLISLKLLSTRRVETTSRIILSEIKDSIKGLYTRADLSSSSRVLVDMKQWFGDLNLNVLFKIVVGKRFYDGGPDSEQGRRQRKVMRDWFHYSGLFVPADAFPFLAGLDLGGHEKMMMQTAKDLDEVMDRLLREHRANGSGNLSDEDKDFMDVMISEMENGGIKADQHDLDTVIKAACMVLIAGGTDTTAVALEWTLALLLNNGHVLNKAQAELDARVGRERLVNESDLSNLTYLQAVIKESLRVYPPGPLGGFRLFTEDSTVAGYHVPKDTWLVVNMWKLHRDPRVWSEDANEFRPERFLEGKAMIGLGGRDFEIIPFGSGRRVCPGYGLGIRKLNLVLASVLQAFDFETVDGQPMDMTESPGMSNAKATPLDAIATPRLSPHLY